MSKLPIKTRAVKASDIDFIISSWTKSYRNSFFAHKIPNGIYFNEHKKIIANRFSDSDAILAYHDDDEDLILGYIVFNPRVISNVLVVHYLYIKHHYRGLGVAKTLMEQAEKTASHLAEFPIVVTHTTSNFKRFCNKYFVYNPYMILGSV